MSTAKTLKIVSTSSSATERLGARLGKQLRGSEVIELASDVGGGKTTFVRGLVQGTGSSDHVASPTFTVSKVYKTPQFEIHHLDFYRLQDAGIMEHEVSELVNQPPNVVVVEWGGSVEHVLPKTRLVIKIAHQENDEREFTFEYPEELTYLIEGL